jgi:RNA polymerase sigma-70 factor (ECF subfamily)
MPYADSIRPDGASEDAPGDAGDAVLIAQWRAGDERAASRLVGRHAEALVRFVGRLGALDEVDDLVQETFIKAFGALDGFRADSSFRTWLFTIARRLVIDRRRAQTRRGSTVELDEGMTASGYDVLDDLVASEQGERIREALATLTRLQRGVFLARVQDGLSYRDIADTLGTTEGAARVHYHNAVRAVQEHLHA